MPGCAPGVLVVRIDATEGAVFDFRPSYFFASGPLLANTSLGRGEPGSVIELVVGGSFDMNGFVGMCVSCNSTLSSGGSNSVVECSVGKVRPRIVLGKTAGVWTDPVALRTEFLVFVRCLGRTGVLNVTRPGPEKKSSQF